MKKLSCQALLPALFCLVCTSAVPILAPAARAEATPSAAPAAPSTPVPSTATEPTPASPAAGTPSTSGGEDAKQQATVAYNLGLAAVKKSDWATAAANFEKATTLDATDASALMFLGFARLKQENYDGALTALQAAERLIPATDGKSRATLYNNLGLAPWNKNQKTEAIESYQRALQADKDASDARYNLAFAFLSQKRYQDAIPHLEALAKTSGDAALLDALGEAYENVKDFGKALGAYGKAIALRPNEAAYQLHMALALVSSNRKTDAIPYLRKVITLDPQSTDPQSAEAFLQLGAIAIEKTRWNEAQDMLRRYVALRPNDPAGWYNLGVAYD
ncbi:MAG: tetratricopeptide repeat protein, partial [Armatimonadota bacterium]|nr:tetratricopeptide repeat protein [Armatimonadota bacterium]